VQAVAKPVKGTKQTWGTVHVLLLLLSAPSRSSSLEEMYRSPRALGAQLQIQISSPDKRQIGDKHKPTVSAASIEVATKAVQF